MATEKDPDWYVRLQNIVSKIEKSETHQKSTEARAMGFCPICNKPIDQDELSKMTKSQKTEYKLAGYCIECQGIGTGPTCEEALTAFMLSLEDERDLKEYNKEKARRGAEESAKRTTQRQKGKEEDEENIIDEDFL